MRPEPGTDGLVRGISLTGSLIVSEWLLWHHVFWRDEAQAVMIADHSPTLHILFSHLGYEGTPGLWQFLLWLGGFLPPWWDMKVWTALVTAATLYILFYKLDLSWPLALTYSLGVQLGTWSLISRSYGLSVLFLLLFGYLEKKWRREPVRGNCLKLSLVLFLLTQTNIHSVLIAAGIFVFLSLENVSGQRPVAWLPAAALVLGALAAAWQVLPPPDLGVGSAWHTGGPGYTPVLLSLPLRVLVPVYLHSGWVVTAALSRLGNWSGHPSAVGNFGILVLALAAYPAFFGLLRGIGRPGGRSVAVVLAVAVPLSLLAALGAFKYMLELQQLYLLLPYVLALNTIEGQGRRRADRLVLGVLLLQLVSVAVHAGPLLQMPFSDSAAIVSWIESRGYGTYLSKGEVAVFPDPSISSLSLYGDLKNGAWALSAGRYETFSPWDRREPNHPWTLPPAVLPGQLPGRPGPYLLVTYYPSHLDFSLVQARLLTHFAIGYWSSWPGSRGAFVYLVRAKSAGP